MPHWSQNEASSSFSPHTGARVTPTCGCTCPKTRTPLLLRRPCPPITCMTQNSVPRVDLRLICIHVGKTFRRLRKLLLTPHPDQMVSPCLFFNLLRLHGENPMPEDRHSGRSSRLGPVSRPHSLCDSTAPTGVSPHKALCDGD